MRLDVVGVAVSAELVVRDQHLRTHLADDLDQEVRRLGEVGVPERVGTRLVERAAWPSGPHCMPESRKWNVPPRYRWSVTPRIFIAASSSSTR